MSKKGNVFDYVNSILFTKEDLSSYEVEYVPFLVNRAIAGHIDCVIYANEMNRYNDLQNDIQYKYLVSSVRKAKRKFAPWIKRQDDRELGIIQQYYGYSYHKALEVKEILSSEQIDLLEQQMIEDKGGIDD